MPVVKKIISAKETDIRVLLSQNEVVNARNRAQMTRRNSFARGAQTNKTRLKG
jgi:hypothetical protein